MDDSEIIRLFRERDSTMTDDSDNYFWYRYTFMPFTDEYIARIQSGDIQLKQVLYDTSQNNSSTNDKEYLLMDKSGAVRIWRADYDPTFFTPYGDLTFTDRYILSGAEMTSDINEGAYNAAAFCDKYFSETLPFTELPAAKRLSSEVSLSSDGSYKVTLARSFNGVLFDTVANSHVIKPAGWPYTSDDPTYPRTDTASALISKDGELLYASIDTYNDILTPEGERIDSIISLEKAADIAEQINYKANDLAVENVSLIYFDKCLPPYSSNYKSYSNARLNWRFMVKGNEILSGDDAWYYIYVDALDGTAIFDTVFAEDN